MRIAIIEDDEITRLDVYKRQLPKLLGTASAVDACERFYQGGMQK